MTRDDLLHLRNFGDKSLEELEERLGERGIHPWGVPSASTEAMAEA
jgi:DNA-directed RNA polymerase alpha subunit